MNRHALSDRQWARLQPLLPKNNGRPPKMGDRNFFDAIVYISRVGCSWRDLPADFGPWKSIYNRFLRWTEKGIWEAIFSHLSKDTGTSLSIMDSTIIRAHQDSSGGRGGPKKNALGRSLRGFSCKLNAVTEASGKPIFWSLTAGQVPDCLEAEKAIGKVQGHTLIADKGYDSTKIARALAARGIRPLNPCRSTRVFPRKIDYRVYRRRIRIERSFHEIKRFRAIATRYCKRASTFISLVYVVSVVLWWL